MSRIGKKPIKIPEGVDVKIDTNKVLIKGPKGELSRTVSPKINVVIKGDEIVLNARGDDRELRALWGLERALIANMVLGTKDGFQKELEVIGVGYRAAVKGKELVLSVGFSNPVPMHIPDDIEVEVKKNIIKISGADKQLVGQFAADVRDVKKPEPYKGKGIKYVNEYIIRKEGKKAAAVEGAAGG
ncbi:MAG: 50S ribosomal protein L6 [uncultured bacterium]|nr:MAG: 50S ribosomal protein L6 [uncultured bacterium]